MEFFFLTFEVAKLEFFFDLSFILLRSCDSDEFLPEEEQESSARTRPLVHRGSNNGIPPQCHSVATPGWSSNKDGPGILSFCNQERGYTQKLHGRFLAQDMHESFQIERRMTKNTHILLPKKNANISRLIRGCKILCILDPIVHFSTSVGATSVLFTWESAHSLSESRHVPLRSNRHKKFHIFN